MADDKAGERERLSRPTWQPLEGVGPWKASFQTSSSSSVKSGSLWFLPLGGLCGLGELSASVLPVSTPGSLTTWSEETALPQTLPCPISPRVKEATVLAAAPEPSSASSLHSSKHSMALVPPTYQRLPPPPALLPPTTGPLHMLPPQ